MTNTVNGNWLHTQKTHFQYTAVEIIKKTPFPFVFDVSIVIIDVSSLNQNPLCMQMDVDHFFFIQSSFFIGEVRSI